MVIKLTDVLDKFKVSLIEGNAIPTEVIGALKLAPISKIPINNIKVCFYFYLYDPSFYYLPKVNFCYTVLNVRYKEHIILYNTFVIK